MKTQVAELREIILSQILAAASRADLYEVKVKYWGKSGKMTDLMKSVSQLPKEERPEAGKWINQLRDEVEKHYLSRDLDLKKTEIDQKMLAEEMDLTQPGQGRALGSSHLVSKVSHEIYSILARVGFSVRQGPLVESDFYNFTALNFPEDHPAREMQDTFFVRGGQVLRTHTSPIQIRTMEAEAPPYRIVGLGAVFRCDSDISHLPHFHQIEGMWVDKNVSMAHLKGTIDYFVGEFFGAGLKTRFRPSFFPFTEPSAEVDCQCPICKGKGCALCKQSGWVEIGGCGMINPNVFSATHIPYPDWNGFAFGFGIERMAIIKYGVNDIRLFPENDLRFLKQFP